MKRYTLIFALLLGAPLLANTPPTLSTTVATSFTAVGDKSTGSVSWQAGDVIVVSAVEEGTGGTLQTPTATGLTFTRDAGINTGSVCATWIGHAVAGSAGSSVISMTNTDKASLHWGFRVWVYTNTGGVGNSAEQHTATKTVSLTPTQADSAIVWMVGDFNAGAVGSGTPTPTHTNEAALDSGRYTFYDFDLGDQVSTGATSYGITGTSSTGPFSIVVLEVKGTTGGGSAPPHQLTTLGVGMAQIAVDETNLLAYQFCTPSSPAPCTDTVQFCFSDGVCEEVTPTSKPVSVRFLHNGQPTVVANFSVKQLYLPLIITEIVGPPLQ